MRIKYRRQHNNRRRFSQIVLSLGILALIFAVLSLTGQVKYITKYFYASALSGVSLITDKLNDIHDVLTPKATLLKENQELRTTLQKAQTVSQYNQALQIENNHLKSLLTNTIGVANNTPTPSSADALARIIDYKDSPYGSILAKVEAGDTSIQPGALVHFGKLAIGSVSETDDSHLLIKLFTASDAEHSVLVANTAATFYGTSNSTGKITLSRKINVEIGDIVSLPQSGGLILGTVEKIDHNIEESTQTLMIRAPLKISELQFISITNE